MIKLIASDIDGTLITGGQTELSEELFGLIRAFKEKGVIFCASSGRQCTSVKRLFRPVEEDVYLMCENGSGLYHRGETLMTRPLEKEKALEIIRQLYARDDCEVLISADGTLYILPVRKEIAHRTVYLSVNSSVHMARRVEDIPGEVLRVSAYCHEGSRRVEEALGEAWRQQGVRVAVSTQNWIDFTAGTKGEGLKGLCSLLGIDLKDTVALGDNYNDLTLLEAAGRAYLMETAPQPLKEKFPLWCRRAEDTLRQLLAEC